MPATSSPPRPRAARRHAREPDAVLSRPDAAAARTLQVAGSVGARATPAKLPSQGAHKGQHTRAAILNAALRLSTQVGLEGLSIGALAELMHMSKSGVFAHFGSREELQICVIREYHQRFEDEVFLPALREARGLPRLRALFERWLKRVALESDSGCIYISGAVEFDDRPGPVRDALAQMAGAWHAALERAIRLAITAGQLNARADPAQMLFEIHGLVLALHYHARFLHSPHAVDCARQGLERILASHGAGPRPAAAKRAATSRRVANGPSLT